MSEITDSITEEMFLETRERIWKARTPDEIQAVRREHLYPLLDLIATDHDWQYVERLQKFYRNCHKTIYRIYWDKKGRTT